MKILVIGNGFIATSIIQRLEAEGHELLIYSRSQKKDIKSEQIIGDIFQFENFVKTLSWRPQVIIHTAWITTHGFYASDPSNYKYEQFTSNLARHIAKTDVRHLIVLGTCAEYGPQSMASTAGITKLNPNNIYAQQKVVAFNSARNLLLKSDVRLSWARIFQPYGPNQDKNRLLPYLIDSLKKSEKIQLSDTASILDWITTRDIASAISWIIHNEVPTEIDLGSTVGFTNIELLRHLEKLLGFSNQWSRIDREISSSSRVSLVGKDSPLFKSGWLPNDNLNTGLEWVLGL